MRLFRKLLLLTTMPASSDKTPVQTPSTEAPASAVLVCDWDTARERARAIRYSVFVEEQGVPVELEWDDMDAPSWHALAFAQDGTPVATGRLLPDGHIGRMAVLRVARGTGMGASVLDALMAKAVELGYGELILNAQTHAAPFYARVGFEQVGEEFEEASIPHIEMRKRLG
ncbi:GNAT family N-acetyltransferase [Cupriavidus pauculus]